MIKGASQADVALLVVPAGQGEFESALSLHAQTREHAILLKALGVHQVVVVVNKMDCTQPSWSEQRFHAICHTLGSLLAEMQFAPQDITYIPVSGLQGQNLLLVSEDCALLAWYSGPSLLAALDNLHLPARQVGKSFRARAEAFTATSSYVSSAPDLWNVHILQGKIQAGRNVGVAKCSAGKVTLYQAKISGIYENKDTQKEKMVCIAREKVCIQLLLAKLVYEQS
jgi:translation elongation factor EF-1alpha